MSVISIKFGQNIRKTHKMYFNSILAQASLQNWSKFMFRYSDVDYSKFVNNGIDYL